MLEIAAGTGVLTRRLAIALPGSTSLVATDLNASMLQQAIAIGTQRPIQWQVADALQLPFADASFDAVVCQFGVMFFPDKARAYAEIRRVLQPHGKLLFNVWDRIEENEFAALTELALERLFPARPPRFLSRTPYGYYDPVSIERELAEGGFSLKPEVYTIAAQSRADSALVPAEAYCLGTPLRNEIESYSRSALGAATDCVAEAIARRFGTSSVVGKIQARVFSVAR